MQCLDERFIPTVMTRSSCGPRQFLSRGQRTVHGEWMLFRTTHNLLTLWTTTRRQMSSRLRKNYRGAVETQWSV